METLYPTTQFSELFLEDFEQRCRYEIRFGQWNCKMMVIVIVMIDEIKLGRYVAECD